MQTLDGDAMNYAAAGQTAARVGGMLAAHGAGRGDRVVVIAPNSLDFVRLWLGVAHIGATLIPLNPGLHGGFLAHQLRVAGAHTVVCDGAHAAALAAVRDDIPAPSALISIGENNPALRADAQFEQWAAAAATAPEPADPRDPACVMFTSGTTGPSKGVLMPHGHCCLLGLGVVDNMALTAEDRYYVAMPLYHANALFMQLYATLIAGASAVLRDRFSASAWLADIRRHRCTITNLLGAMSHFVIQQPGHRSDRDHHLRAVLTAPNPPGHEAAWRERFGVRDVVSAYGMTEANIPAYGRLGDPVQAPRASPTAPISRCGSATRTPTSPSRQIPPERSASGPPCRADSPRATWACRRRACAPSATSGSIPATWASWTPRDA